MITDIRMSIPAMTIFMLKWLVASIPVVLIVGAVYVLILLFAVGGCAALMAGARQ